MCREGLKSLHVFPKTDTVMLEMTCQFWCFETRVCLNFLIIIKKEFKIIKSPKKALNYAKKIADENDLILVTGSFYVVGEVFDSKNLL